LAAVLHHIAFDGWSISILVKELSSLYKDFTTGRASELPVPSIQYVDYAIWQRRSITGSLLEEKLSYWKQQLNGVEPIALETDYPRPAHQSIRGAVIHKKLNKELLDRV